MACGLPIISSDRDFNWDILDNSNAILINPQSISEIKSAIVQIKEHPEQREKMSKASLKKARSLDIKKRAQKIISIMEANI